MKNVLHITIIASVIVACTQGVTGPAPEMVEIPGTERIHGFSMSCTEITNDQYEVFFPEHRELRGKDGFSVEDDDAVTYVSWDDAMEYCRRLSKATGRTFRLPTEAEWEYACRAGTDTPFYTGDTLPASLMKHQKTERNMVSVSLKASTGPANVFGLYGMHGNVEEWCMDWYGEIPLSLPKNFGGPRKGILKVTRGGSHNTPVEYLSSNARAAAIPSERHCQIGFRIVESDKPLEYTDIKPKTPRNQSEVSQTKHVYPVLDSKTLWMDPIPFVIAPDDGTPFYSHNHQPAITWCDNGDLLVIWFSCNQESSREMVVLGSRLRNGSDSWEPASLFFHVPTRNLTGSSLCRLDDGTLLHMNGVSLSGEWQNLALCSRRSTDNGATWSAPVLVAPEHAKRHQVIAGPIILSDGTIIQCCDAGPAGEDGTAVHLSSDNGFTWKDPWDGAPLPEFKEGGIGTTIAGIHAGLVELKDGSLLALGRGNSIDGRMPQSRSYDRGATWEYSATEFSPIGSGQRLVLRRLDEGPVMLASFGENGLFVSLSHDECRTWTTPKLVSSTEARTLDGGAWTGSFIMDKDHAEPKGYLACTQTPDGTIHLLSSRMHYRFNLAWILEGK